MPLSTRRRVVVVVGTVLALASVGAVIALVRDDPDARDSLRSLELPRPTIAPAPSSTASAVPVVKPPTALPTAVVSTTSLPTAAPVLTSPPVVATRTLSPGQLAVEHDRALGYHGIPPHCAPSHGCAYPGVWGAILGGARDVTVTVAGPHTVHLRWYTEDAAGYDNGGPLTGFLVFAGTADFAEFETTREVDKALRSATLTGVPSGRHVICVGEFNVEGLSAGACQPDILVPGDPTPSPTATPTATPAPTPTPTG